MDEKLRQLLFEIKDSLKRIELLFEKQKQNPTIHYHCYTGINSTPVFPQCTCHQYTPGSLTGGWFCPVHGQVF